MVISHIHTCTYTHTHTHVPSQGCFGLLTALVTVLPRALDEHIGAIVPGVVYCLKLVLCGQLCVLRMHGSSSLDVIVI